MPMRRLVVSLALVALSSGCALTSLVGYRLFPDAPKDRQGETLQVRIRTAEGEIRVVTVDPADSVDNVQLVGLDLVARYPASLELAGVILLMAMFGAVVLARRQIELGEDERRKAAGMAGMVLDLPENERGGS